MLEIGILLGKSADEIRREFTDSDLTEYIAYIQLKNEVRKDPVNIYPKQQRKKMITDRIKNKLKLFFGEGKKRDG
jgi:hypothetical protein